MSVNNSSNQVRFAIAFFTTLGLVLLTTALINAVVNPYAIYPTQWFPPVAVNDLDRAVDMLQNPALEPQLVVFGSSRSSRLRPRDLECYSGLTSANASFSNATPDSYYALASYMLDIKPSPKMMIIGVDVEAFQPPEKFGDRLGNVPRLQKYLRPNRLEGTWFDATQLFSFAQLSDSVRDVQHTLQPTPAADANTSPQDKTDNAPPLKIIENSEESTPKRAIQSYEKRFGDYTALSQDQKDYFEALVKLATDKHIALKIFITPLSPTLIDDLTRQGMYPQRHLDVRNWLTQLRGKYPFEFYDLSTIDTFGGNDKDFYNLAHINDVNSARLIGVLFSESGRAAQCAPKK